MRFKERVGNLWKSRFFRRIIFTFIIPSVIIFYIIMITIIANLNRQYKEDVIARNDGQVVYVQENVSDILGEVFMTGLAEFSEDAQLKQVIYGTQWDIFSMITADKLIDSIMKTSNYIHSVYLLNLKTENVVTNFCGCKLEDFFDQEMLSYLENVAPSSAPLLFKPRYVNRYAGYPNDKTKETLVWSLVFYESSRGAFVVNIDAAAFEDILDIADAKKEEVYVLNRENKVLIGSQEDTSGYDFEKQELLNKITETGKKSGHILWKQDGKQYTVSYSTNTSYGIRVILLHAYPFIDTTNGLLGLTLMLSVVYLIICILMAFFVGLIVYRPVGQLKNKVLSYHLENDSKEEADEFSLFSNAYVDMIQKNLKLEKYRGRWEDQKQMQHLSSFLQGSLCAISSQDYMNLTYLFDKKKYRIVIMQLDLDGDKFQGDREILPNEVGLVTYAVANVADELFQENYTSKFIEDSYLRLIYILNYDDTDDEQLRNLLTYLQNFLNNHFHHSLSIGISTEMDEIEDLPEARTEAENALNRRLVTGYNSIHFYGTQELFVREQQYYPFEMEGQLQTALKSLKSQNVDEILEEFCEKISIYDYSRIQLYVMWMVYNIQRFAYANHLESSIFTEEGLYSLDIPLNKVCENLKNVCHIIIQEIENVKNNNDDKNKLIEEIIRLIDENIYNPNLSVIFLAGEVHLSVNYLRSIYKEKTSESLSGYITTKKLDLIKSLLENTTDSIQEISDKLGFTTKNYFFTFFKKHMGITPSQYRKLNEK